MDNNTNPPKQASDVPTITGNEPVADISFSQVALEEPGDSVKTNEPSLEIPTKEMRIPTSVEINNLEDEQKAGPKIETAVKPAASTPPFPPKTEYSVSERPAKPAIKPEAPGVPPEIEKILEERTIPKRPEPLKMPGSPEMPEEPKLTEQPSSLWSIRTFKSDVAASVKGNKTSLTHMVLAEENRRREAMEFTSPKSSKNILLISLSIILLVAGSAAAAFMFYKSREPKIASVAAQYPPLLFAENQKTIEVTGKSASQLAKLIGTEVQTANYKLDTVENVFFTETINGTSVPVPTDRFFAFLDSRMPAELSRSLENNFMFGIHTFNGNHPFLVFRTNYYENSFAGMLEWEQYMARDLFPIFAVKESPAGPVYDRAFEDGTIKNRDVRLLRNDSGEIVLFYTFTDKKTLVITNVSDTLEEVIRRLNSSAPVAR